MVRNRQLRALCTVITGGLDVQGHGSAARVPKLTSIAFGGALLPQQVKDRLDSPNRRQWLAMEHGRRHPNDQCDSSHGKQQGCQSQAYEDANA